MKNSYQAQRVIEEVVKEKPKARWLFLTLSTRNAIDGEHLNQSLKEMAYFFNHSLSLITIFHSTPPITNRA